MEGPSRVLIDTLVSWGLLGIWLLLCSVDERKKGSIFSFMPTMAFFQRGLDL